MCWRVYMYSSGTRVLTSDLYCRHIANTTKKVTYGPELSVLVVVLVMPMPSDVCGSTTWTACPLNKFISHARGARRMWIHTPCQKPRAQTSIFELCTVRIVNILLSIHPTSPLYEAVGKTCAISVVMTTVSS